MVHKQSRLRHTKLCSPNQSNHLLPYVVLLCVCGGVGQGGMEGVEGYKGKRREREWGRGWGSVAGDKMVEGGGSRGRGREGSKLEEG